MMEMRLLFKHYPQIRRVSSFMVYAFKVSTFLQSSVSKNRSFFLVFSRSLAHGGKKKSYIVFSFDLNLQGNLEQTVTTTSTQLEKAQRMTNSLSFHPACLNSLIFAFVTYLVSLMDKVGLQKNSCKIIDVTNKRGTVETLTEAKISCAIEEVCNS